MKGGDVELAQRKTVVRGERARYTNRNMPASILRDMKLMSARSGKTMEEICNEALKIGLKQLRTAATPPEAQATA